MATIDFAARAIYKTYRNGAEYTNDPRRIGYSTDIDTDANKYVTVYKFTMPVADGKITSISLTPYVSSAGYAVAAEKTWQLNLVYQGTSSFESNASYASLISGVGTVNAYYNVDFSNGSNKMTASDTTTTINCGTKTVSIDTVVPVKFSTSTTTNYLYICVQSGVTGQANLCKIASLTGNITYTPTTYYATKGTCTYANASVSPTSGTSGTSYTFKAWSNANDDNYIYGNLRWSYGAGSGGFTDPSYASGYGGTQSQTKTGSFNKDFTYTAEADRWKADPGDAKSITASNITATSAKITVNASLTTTFLNSYYYITATNSGDIAESLTSSTKFSRSTGYINLTSGLTTGASNIRYVYAFNSYNDRYYKIGSVTFTTDQSSYSATISSSNIGAKKATINISGLSSTANLNSNWYLTDTTNSATATSLSNYMYASRSSSITLSSSTTISLSPGKTKTLYAYVYSSASSKYYKVGSIIIKTHSYIYYTDSNGNLIPCWTYMLIDGVWTQVLLDIPNYKT